MTLRKLIGGFGIVTWLFLGVTAAGAYQEPELPQPDPFQEPTRPERTSPDDAARPPEEEASRARLKALLEEHLRLKARLHELEAQREQAAAEPEPSAPSPDDAAEAVRRARIEGFLDAQKIDEIRPAPPFEIPDPPPHEGALIDYPYVIEPPDLLVVEVLEALPGRPITGERLVRPDGTISLDFYGKIHVRGLSREQVKEKLILHMRRFLTDDALGLLNENADSGELSPVPPRDSDRVFVDVAAYNHAVYYVQGDVSQPGRLPFTGHETVLDAINYAGGIAPTADPHDIVLVRPACGSKPPREYPIDYDAILKGGDPTANLQVFPGDRLVVGRHPTVRATVAIDRVNAPINAVVQTILTASHTIRALSQALDNPNLTADQRRALVDAWVELLWPIAEGGDASRIDKDGFREMLRRGLAPDANAGP